MLLVLLILGIFSVLVAINNKQKLLGAIVGITSLIGGFFLSLCYSDMLLIFIWLEISLQLIFYAYWQQTSKGALALQIAMLGGLIYIGYMNGCAEPISVILAVFFIAKQWYDRDLLNSYENYNARYQNKLLHKQIEEVNHIYTTMREWRHDYHSHLQSLKAKIDQDQIEEARAYLDDLEQELADIKQIVETGNVNVDAILNSKLSLALVHDIDINVKVMIPKSLPINDIDCCVLLGNLLDNAIEACDKVKDHKYLRLYMGLYKKQLYISMTNATDEIVRKLDEEYISHKRGNHGHGLKRINKVVEKYNGYINRQNEPGVFVTEIMLPMNNIGTK
ncbi:MAG: GHKL domain-containing protein [Erysipelotrichaceae bacterium]|nr:GHKL domain-containing protein [Erysipelotrichaceae bacterium]MDY5251945.1 GHKL domain-containing protein [Erysipelotrichaceae bacterium]